MTQEINPYYEKIQKQINAKNFVVIMDMLNKYEEFLSKEELSALKQSYQKKMEESRAEQEKWETRRHTPLSFKIMRNKPLRYAALSVLLVIMAIWGGVGAAIGRRGEMAFSDIPSVLQFIFILTWICVIVWYLIARLKK